MFKILIVDNGVIDRKMMKTILTEELGEGAELQSAGTAEEAKAQLEERQFDLLIADVPFNVVYAKDLIRKAYGTNADMKVILTSVKSEGEMAQLANKLHVERFLLKPFTRRTFVEAVRPTTEAVRAIWAREGEKQKAACVEKIAAEIQDCQYKKCIETAKEYIDFLYDSGDNMSVTRTKVVEFSAAIVELGQLQSAETKRRLTEQFGRFKARFDLQSNRFTAASAVEEMISLIFGDMETSQMYPDDALKKVLNYIDRNIKKGISLEEAAEYINMSSTYFSKLFKKFTGTNFITYVTNRKVECAKEMLENTDMPVINIAYELAYNEANYFCKAFKKKVGVTPTEYREQHLKRLATGA